MRATWTVWDGEAAADRKQWIDLWSDSAERHPFAHPDVCAALRPKGGRLMAASLSHTGGHVLYPFFLREIDGDLARAAGLTGDDGAPLYDLVSPYGYGGPMHWCIGDVAAATVKFEADFAVWAEQNRVVSEFARLSLFEESLLPFAGHTRKRQTNLVRDLEVTSEELSQAVASKVRSNVRRAHREGVTIVVDTDGRYVDDFVRIYSETMERRDSVDWYRFKRPFFESLHTALPGQFAYVYAHLDGLLVSSDLLLFGREVGYYFLGGTEAAAFRARPNDLVKMESMKWLKERGCKKYVLGGGVTAEDSLERYKRGFAPTGQVDYFTRERIFSAARYDRLLAAHRLRLSAVGREFDETGDYFPAYRRETEPTSQTRGADDSGASSESETPNAHADGFSRSLQEAAS
ncbi:GNAT family N-acetyltransferase [Brevibacterium linens ATCC 9172]|uniref:Acetyltransferase (GNAT) domain-containing protein n=2 Tax=Brevibacterium linens TaxID=1703 RepID=A0A2H1JTT8_BRELN|nr:GNAT family N-acetyltransferase [Brevibacterium linens ATCC 9172]SMX90871.1 Acetyltransferase (GNAT) domain-containing protein [Brevibacterium linens ATCC 9172]